MKSRIDQIPVYESRQVTLRSQDFNLVKIALKRISNPLRFEIPKLRTLDFILEDDLWVIVDRSLNDIPVMAWNNFNDQARTSLHEDIHCQKRIYHTHAHMIHDKAIEALQLVLGEKLNADQIDVEDNISQFKKAELK